MVNGEKKMSVLVVVIEKIHQDIGGRPLWNVKTYRKNRDGGGNVAANNN